MMYTYWGENRHHLDGMTPDFLRSKKIGSHFRPWTFFISQEIGIKSNHDDKIPVDGLFSRCSFFWNLTPKLELNYNGSEVCFCQRFWRDTSPNLRLKNLQDKFCLGIEPPGSKQFFQAAYPLPPPLNLCHFLFFLRSFFWHWRGFFKEVQEFKIQLFILTFFHLKLFFVLHGLSTGSFQSDFYSFFGGLQTLVV